MDNLAATEGTYSEEGPQCPHCKEQYTADEAYYYSESFTEMHCGTCNKPFEVSVDTCTSWTCYPFPAAAEKGETE